MQKTFKLEDITWAANVTKQVKLDMLPPGHRVLRFDLYFDLSGTKDSADALAATLWARAVSNIKLSNFVPAIDGWGLQEMMRQILGRWPNKGTDIPGSGTTFSMPLFLQIPFRNPRQQAYADGAIPTELLHGKSIDITFSAANVWGVGNLLLTAGTVRVTAEIIHETNVPQLMELGYFNPGSQTIQVPPGVYTDLFLTDDSSPGVPGTITKAEVSSVSMEADGDPIWSDTLHEAIVSSYNSNAVRDSADELTVNAATRLPLIWQDQSGKAQLSKQVAIEHAGKLQLAGTLVAPRVYYWRALQKDNAAVNAIAAATGAPSDATEYEPHTASKKPLRAADKTAKLQRQPKKVRILGSALPGKVRAPGTENK